MVDSITTGSASIVQRSDLGEGDGAEVEYWLLQEEIANKENLRWHRRAHRIVDRYRDKRDDGGVSGEGSNVHRYNVLWSNTQTLIPALYSRSPKADVERRFKDQDDIGRLAATLLERAIDYALEDCDFDSVMTKAVEDRLLPGRGLARVLYLPTFGDEIKATGAELENDDNEAASGDAGEIASEGDEGEEREVVGEYARIDYVYWEDYLEGLARTWQDVPWVRFRAYMTRDELIRRFGSRIGNRINLDWTPPGSDKSEGKGAQPLDAVKKAIVHETWDKQKKRVVWWGPGTPDLVFDEKDDPLQLPDFFPNPDPLFATTTTDRRIPVPDYVEYQDQARELDLLTMRIDRLTRALKVSGVYAGAEKQVLQQLVSEGMENRMIPVEDWNAFAVEKGGIEKLIMWMPIQQIAQTLIQLYDARDKVKQVLYEITGMADIIRGSNNPQSTATVERIKSQFITMRLSRSQKDVSRFARDCMRLLGYVIARNFATESLERVTGYPQLLPVPPAPPQAAPVAMVGQPPQSNPQYQQWLQQNQPILAENAKRRQQFEQAVQLLRDDAPHDFRIDIEADSTAAIDEEADKQARIEFLTRMVPLIEQSATVAQGNPPMAALMKEVALFGARGFRIGRSLEETIETTFDTLAKMPPPQGGKGMAEIQAEGQIAAQDSQAKLQIAQIDAQTKMATNQSNEQIEAAKLAASQQRDRGQNLIDLAKMEQSERLSQARVQHIEAESARGLR